jgi:hypothetical protein
MSSFASTAFVCVTTNNGNGSETLLVYLRIVVLFRWSGVLFSVEAL